MYDSQGNFHEDATDQEFAELVIERRQQKQQAEQKRQKDEAWSKQVKEFAEEHPDVDLDELSKDEKFLKFAKGKSQPLKELYKDYAELAETPTRRVVIAPPSNSREFTVLPTRGFDPGGHAGLTAEEMKSVDDWNAKTSDRGMKMTYIEFKRKGV